MNIPETFYIALCVTILMLGIVYWFWTQVQYLQRKVNLLDNVVYEMKTFIANLPGPEAKSGNTFMPVPPQEESPVANVYNPPPESVAGDLEAERLASEIEFEPFAGENNNSDHSQHMEHIEHVVETVYSEPPEDSTKHVEVNDDLQPGGLASGASVDSKQVDVFTDSAIESPLSSMSIKELRRMAEANNIPGSAELKKRDLIRALRDKVGQIIGTGSKDSNVLSFDDIGAPGSE
jgi:hypothetical protein